MRRLLLYSLLFVYIHGQAQSLPSLPSLPSHPTLPTMNFKVATVFDGYSYTPYITKVHVFLYDYYLPVHHPYQYKWYTQRSYNWFVPRLSGKYSHNKRFLGPGDIRWPTGPKTLYEYKPIYKWDIRR
jgi:hypothetical protein